MASSQFGLWLLLRLVLLSLGIAAQAYAFLQLGLHVLPAALLVLVLGQIVELWTFLQRTNRELTRFLASARHADFSQNFDLARLGCGFRELGETFSDILARLKQVRLNQEVELRQLRAMVDHLPVPLLAIYDDGRLQLVNNAARRFFARQQLGLCTDLQRFGPDLYKQIMACRAGDKRQARINIDGNESQLVLSLTVISSDLGSVRLLSLQDIGQELALAQLDAWQDLVRVLTHEIMNSITPVASLAQTTADMADDLVEGLPQDDPHQARLARISSAAGTVARRAGNLLQFVANYRQLTGLPEPHKRRLTVQELLAHVAGLVSAKDSSPTITLQMEVTPPGLELLVDPEQIEQVLINLLRNAEQALARGTDCRIMLAAFLDARGRVTLEVRDNGPGIEDKIIDRIFVPYFTTKPDGSGIGLALARQIMMAHGGNIRARNADNGGAIFTLTF